MAGESMRLREKTLRYSIVVRRVVPRLIAFCAVLAFLSQASGAPVSAGYPAARHGMPLALVRLTTKPAPPTTVHRRKPLHANNGCITSFFPCDLSPGQDLTD